MCGVPFGWDEHQVTNLCRRETSWGDAPEVQVAAPLGSTASPKAQRIDGRGPVVDQRPVGPLSWVWVVPVLKVISGNGPVGGERIASTSWIDELDRKRSLSEIGMQLSQHGVRISPRPMIIEPATQSRGVH